MDVPHVDPVDVGVTWHASGSWSLESDDAGNTQLTLLAHLDDPDQRSVRLEWSGCVGLRREGPNDEARSGHPLNGSGLEDVVWIGVVADSPLVDRLDEASDSLRHWILPLDECVVEVVATDLLVDRVDP